CVDGTAAAGATLERSAALSNRLPAGTYYLAVKSQSSTGGNYQITFRDPAYAIPGGATYLSCTTSAGTGYIDQSVIANRDYYVVVKGTTAAAGTFGLQVTDVGAVPATTCDAASADKGAPDAYVDFSVTDS